MTGGVYLGWGVLAPAGEMRVVYFDGVSGGPDEARQYAAGALRYHPDHRIVRVELREVPE